MDNSDICAVVVCYNPDSDVVGNIATYSTHVDTLYLVDNSDSGTEHSWEAVPGKIELLSIGNNIGVASALNLALKKAAAEGYRWLLTMDQDTSFNAEQLRRLFACRHHPSSDTTLLISPLHQPKKQRPGDTCDLEPDEVVMTSGNLVYVPNAVAIGGYDERLFIDEVDHEFCLRGRLKGYLPMRLYTAHVDHRLGTMKSHGGRKIRIYPPQRLYYMVRNYLYFRKRYQEAFADFFATRDRFLLFFFLNHLRFSSKRGASIVMMLRGWYDYHKERYGRIDEAR